MNTLLLQQLLHGYENGHRRLTGSVKLSEVDEDLITRISDLSGPLLGSDGIPPYFTGYPLPSGKYYAVAMTWLDKQATRTGSVLTHTLLISAKDACKVGAITSALGLLGEEPSRIELGRYKNPQRINSFEYPTPRAQFQDWETAKEFVSKYFGEGIRPILWLDAGTPLVIVRLIIDGLWPHLRQQYAFCTLSLQLRHLDDRPFDLLFAPRSRRNKHHELGQRSIIGSTDGEAFDIYHVPTNHEWIDDFAGLLFLGDFRAEKLSQDFTDLWGDLGPDPTVIRRLYRLRELYDRLSFSPTAVVGAMDIVDSIAPGKDQARSYKAELVSRGIDSIVSLSEPAQSLKATYLLCERLRRSAFESVYENVQTKVIEVVSDATTRNPEVAFDICLDAIVERSKSPYVIGVAKGLSKFGKERPDGLLSIDPPVVSAPALISIEPTIALDYFRASRGTTQADEASRNLARSIREVSNEEDRGRIRSTLIPSVTTHEDALVLRELIRDLSTEDIAVVLNQLDKATEGFSSDTIREVTIELSRSSPWVVQVWGRSKRNWTYGTATIVAGTFPSSQIGLDELLTYKVSDVNARLMLLAYIDLHRRYGMPEWLSTSIVKKPEVFLSVFGDGVELYPETHHVIEKIFEEIPDISFVVDNSLFDVAEKFQNASFGQELLDAAMSRVVEGFVSGKVKTGVYSKWVESGLANEWFNNVQYRRLSSLLHPGGEVKAQRWIRAWSALKRAPDTLYLRRRQILDRLTNYLISNRSENWPEKVSKEWVLIIQRAKSDGTERLHFELCEQCLAYSFSHPELPLSKLVVESFPVVYKEALKKKQRYSPWPSLFFLFTDWDKGAELRRGIVTAFLKSGWPAEDLALAMPDEETFRKIFRRVRQQYKGDSFINNMSVELKKSKGLGAKAKYVLLRKMVDSRDFTE